MPTVSEETTSELAQALVGRLAQCRAVAGEGLPLLLDDAFCDLDPSVKPLLLELLGRSAGGPQIVFLPEDEDVASWARLEAPTGAELVRASCRERGCRYVRISWVA